MQKLIKWKGKYLQTFFWSRITAVKSPDNNCTRILRAINLLDIGIMHKDMQNFYRKISFTCILTIKVFIIKFLAHLGIKTDKIFYISMWSHYEQGRSGQLRGKLGQSFSFFTNSDISKKTLQGLQLKNVFFQ